MLTLVGMKTLKSGKTAYVTCDGYFTGVTVLDDVKTENIPIAILTMYIEPKLVHPKALSKCGILKLIDVDCREMLISVSHITNIRVGDNKISIARQFVSNLPFFEKETIDLNSTPFEKVYRRFNLQNCLAAEGSPYG